MNSAETDTERHWFVMRDLTRPNAKTPGYRKLSEAGFKVFTPLEQKVLTRGSRRTTEFVPVIHDLFFVNSDRDTLDPVVGRIDTVQYRYVRGAAYGTPMTVPMWEMERFIRLVGSCEKVTYYRPEEITPEMYGAMIRIVGGGPLEGYEGRLLTVRGSRRRRLVVTLPGILAAAVEVEPEFIQLVETD